MFKTISSMLKSQCLWSEIDCSSFINSLFFVVLPSPQLNPYLSRLNPYVSWLVHYFLMVKSQFWMVKSRFSWWNPPFLKKKHGPSIRPTLNSISWAPTFQSTRHSTPAASVSTDGARPSEYTGNINRGYEGNILSDIIRWCPIISWLSWLTKVYGYSKEV